ncbi:MAG: peptide chain release factor N(5)-glutamine methyltransferase, partial [Clostridia bacterium]|nr:peptide chain release factor N(5)-glutamine methyltransferase [Clostridia bacterium]
MNLWQLKNELTARLQDACVDAPALQARLVLEKVLSMSAFEMTLQKDRIVTEEEVAQIEAMAKRIESGEPVQYVLGQQQFLDLMLHVEPGVLIPRSETEELADHAANLLNQMAGTPRALDLCTGSGAIALALKHRVPKADVTASDLSDDALAIAKGNAQMLGLDVAFVKSDLFQNIEDIFDMIVSNPPYIPTSDCLQLDRNVRDYEPMMALDGGRDGLDFYRAIAKEAPKHLRADGYLMLEVGFDQSDDVMALLQDEFSHIHVLRDMQDISRMVIARKKVDA